MLGETLDPDVLPLEFAELDVVLFTSALLLLDVTFSLLLLLDEDVFVLEEDDE